jgi:hypothetical protein
MSNTYREDLQALNSAMSDFIDNASWDFSRDEVEAFRRTYGFIMARQDKVAEEIQKEWRK